MFTCKNAPLAAAVAVIVGLAGCGGGGNGGTTPVTPTPVPAAGKMVDGPIMGATVVCESVTVNGKADTGEATTKTDATGNYKFDNCNSPVAGFSGDNVVDASATPPVTYPFTGLLKAPAGSTVVTPLTTLVADTGLEPKALAKLLGLDESIDITKTDPTDPKNFEVLKKTQAVQQLIEELAESIKAGAADPSKVDATQLFAQVATTLAATLKEAATSNKVFITADGLDTSVLTKLADNVKKDVADKVGSTVDVTATINSVKVEAKKFLDAKNASDLTNVAKEQQNPNKPVAGSSYFTLTDNSIEFVESLSNRVQVSLTDFNGTGAVVNALNKFAFSVGLTGTPTVTTSAVAFELSEVGGKRALQIMLDKVKLALDANGKLSATVADDAKLYLYGSSVAGVEVNATLPNVAFKNAINIVDNKLTLDYSAIVAKVLADTTVTKNDNVTYWENIHGTFHLAAAISNFDLRTSDKKVLNQTVNIKNTSVGVSGAGFSGKLTVN